VIAYLDSNVILEIILGQAQAESAQAVLRAAAEGRLVVKLPVFVLYEIEQKLRRLSAVRQDLAVLFRNHARTMGVANREIAAEGERAARAMADRFLLEDHDLRLTKAIITEPLLDVAEVLPLTTSVLVRAMRLANREGSLHLHDAIVAATALEDAQATGEPSALVTKDSDLSRNAAVVEALAELQCRVIGDIAGALAYLDGA